MVNRAISLLSILSLGLYAGCIDSYARGISCRNPVIIAVLDTGLRLNEQTKHVKLCKFGHRDMTRDKRYSIGFNTVDFVPADRIGHGTNIAGIITKKMQSSKVNYCIVIIKVFSDLTYQDNAESTMRAFSYLKMLKPDFVNYSGGGPDYHDEEIKSVKDLLDLGVKIEVAAGNDSSELIRGGYSYYPAMYDKRLTVVGNLDIYGFRDKTSNYGTLVNRWEHGDNVEGFGIYLSGTSQATAVATGILAADSKKGCKK